MDHLLKKFGFLEFSASNVVFGPMQWGPVRKVARKAYDFLGLHGKVSLPQSVNWSKTKAFTTIRSTGEGVSINLAGREPDGIVDPADFEKVRDQVMDALSSFVDPKTGRKPVKAIYRREEIFKGKHADTAPDILMEPAEQYSLTHAKSALEDADWISGDHRLEGVIVAAGPNVKPFEQPPMLVDMAPTILAALDAPASIEHTGRVLARDRGFGREGVSGRDLEACGADPRDAERFRGVERQRHRGRRDGGAPPRSRVPRVAARVRLLGTADLDFDIGLARNVALDLSHQGATLANEMDAAVWIALAILAAMSLGTLFYLGARIDSLAARTDARFDRMDARFDHVDVRFDTLIGRMDSRFDALDARFDALDARFDALAARLDAHLDRHAT